MSTDAGWVSRCGGRSLHSFLISFICLVKEETEPLIEYECGGGSLREEGVKYLTRKMKLGNVAVRFVVIYLKMGQLTQLCIFST